MTYEPSAMTALRRKRRKHPATLRTMDGPEEIVPGLSTWTVEDLLEAGAWDEELAEIADIDDEYSPEDAAEFDD